MTDVIAGRMRSLMVWTAALWLLAGAAALAVADAGAQPGRLLASGLDGAGGATVGPDGALYVVEGNQGQVTRINPRNGKKSLFAQGLPTDFLGLGVGGAIDIEFIDGTAYVLVTLVGEFGPPEFVDGIWRVNGPNDVEPIIDLGAFSAANPPPGVFGVDYLLMNGLQFAMQPIGNGFLVSDGHHNRILHATLDGTVSVLKQYPNIVPTGLAGDFGAVVVAQFGAVPNPPETGKVVTFSLLDPTTDGPTLASGVPMIIDVEFGPDGKLYALSQGEHDGSLNPVAPPLPDAGRLLEVVGDGTFKVLAAGLNKPTSLTFIGRDAYVVGLDGSVRWFANVAK